MINHAEQILSILYIFLFSMELYNLLAKNGQGNTVYIKEMFI